LDPLARPPSPAGFVFFLDPPSSTGLSTFPHFFSLLSCEFLETLPLSYRGFAFFSAIPIFAFDGHDPWPAVFPFSACEYGDPDV